MHEEGEPRGIGPHLVDELVERDEGARPPAHRHRLATPQERHELVDDHLEGGRIEPHGLGGPLHPGDVPVVVGPPHIDHAVEPPGELVDEIGAVRGEVRVRPVAPDQRAILVVAERRRPEPHGALRLEHVPRLAKPPDGGIDLPRLRELPFGDVGVEPHAEPVQGGPDAVEDPPGPLVAEAGHPLLGRNVREGVAVLLQDVPCEVHDVVTVVAVLRHLRLAPQELQVPGLHRGAEPVHLPAGVVEVVLALDPPPGRLEEAGERIAERRVAGVADMQRAGRVRRDELDLNGSAVRLGPSVSGAPGHGVAEHVAEPVGPHEEVEEALSRHLDPFDQVVGRQMRPDSLGHVPGARAHPPGQRERRVRREVAELLLARRGDLDLREVAGEPQLVPGPVQSLADDAREPVLDHRRRGGAPRPAPSCGRAPDGRSRPGATGRRAS